MKSVKKMPRNCNAVQCLRRLDRFMRTAGHVQKEKSSEYHEIQPKPSHEEIGRR